MSQTVVTEVQLDKKLSELIDNLKKPDTNFRKSHLISFCLLFILYDLTSVETTSITTECCLGNHPSNAKHPVSFQSLNIFLQIKETPRFVTMAD